MRRRGITPWALAAALTALNLIPSRAGAQTTCEVNNQTSCLINDPTMTITITVNAGSRLTLGSATATLPVPSALGVEGAGGTAVLFPVTVHSNSSWSVSIQSLSAAWAGTPASARQNKPVGDLEWSQSAGAGFASVGTTATTIATGTATPQVGTTVPLYLRVKYSFLLDKPGSYQLPLRLVLTAP